MLELGLNVPRGIIDGIFLKSECLARTLQAVSKPLVNWVLGAGLKLRHD